MQLTYDPGAGEPPHPVGEGECAACESVLRTGDQIELLWDAPGPAVGLVMAFCSEDCASEWLPELEAHLASSTWEGTPVAEVQHFRWEALTDEEGA